MIGNDADAPRSRLAGVEYERHGAGEPLVLLHGIGHHRGAWQPVLHQLAAVHDVVVVDLPGFGASPAPATPPADMAAVVAQVTAFFDALGLDRPHVAGNSLGGAIALELAAAGRAASVTAIAPAGFCSPRQLRWALRVLSAHRVVARLPEALLCRAIRVSAVRAVAYGMIVARPRRLAVEVALADARALAGARAFRMVARAGRGYAFSGQPMVPVTIAWGDRDRILPYRQAALARRRLPAARHVALAGCGHVPMHDDPDQVVAAILRTTGATGG